MENNNYLKVYWELFDKVSTDSALLYSLLLSLQGYVKTDSEGRMRVADSVIRERFMEWSDYRIKTTLRELENTGMIEVVIGRAVECRKSVNVRWVKIIDYHNAQPNDDRNNDRNVHPNADPNADLKNFDIINNNNIINNKDINNSVNNTLISKNFRSEDYSKSPEDLINFIDNLKCGDDLKESFKNWYEGAAMRGRLSIAAFKDKITNIYEATDSKEDLIKKAVDDACQHCWANFYYKPQATCNKTPVKDRPSESFVKCIQAKPEDYLDGETF